MPPIEPPRAPELPTPERALLDCTRHLQTHGLLRRALTPALAEITAVRSLALTLSITIGQIARLCYDSDPTGTTLQNVQILVVVASSASTPCASCAPAALEGPLDEPEVRPLEWLHLAQSMVALAHPHLPCPVAHALGRTLAQFYPHLISPSTRILPADCPLLTYGAGEFLAIASGNATESAIARAGSALGQMVRLVHEAGDLWCARAAGKPLLAPHLLSRMASDKQDAALKAAWAHAATPQADRSHLQEVLAQPSILRKIVTYVDGWSNTIHAAPVRAAVQTGLLAIHRECREDLDRALSAARLFALVPFKSARETTPSTLDRTIRMAISALLDDTTVRDAWEIQRWGQWCDVPRTGRLFPVGLCLLALAAAEQDVSEPIATLLLQSRRADGWRYYDDWIGIPPDADDLGLVLQLLPASAQRNRLRDALVHPVDLLLRHTQPDGVIPTWLDKDLAEPPPASSPEWLGPQCVGVMANAVLGLVQARWPVPDGYIERVIRFLTNAYETTPEHGIFHYSPAYVHLLFARLWRSLSSTPSGKSALAPLDPILTRIEHELIALQRADGGWGSPQTSACSMELLTLRDHAGFDPEPAVLYLAGRQHGDGFWPAEPLYRCPGKDGAGHTYGSRSVTTAICLQALLIARNDGRQSGL